MDFWSVFLGMWLGGTAAIATSFLVCYILGIILDKISGGF
jgi:hypothetical protein